MKKYSVAWKLSKKEWLQKHSDGLVYRHYIQYGTEYSKLTGYTSIREAARNTGLSY